MFAVTISMRSEFVESVEVIYHFNLATQGRKTFPYLGIEGIKITLRMAWRALIGRGAPRSLPAPVVTTLEAS